MNRDALIKMFSADRHCKCEARELFTTEVFNCVGSDLVRGYGVCANCWGVLVVAEYREQVTGTDVPMKMERRFEIVK